VTEAVAVRLGARDVTRRFGAVVANDRVDLSVAPRTIHAVVGGNGAGKSTLMRILQGVDTPDEGTVVLDDRPVRLEGPADAFARGVGMVHQEFMLAPPLSLLENLILAREPAALGGLVDWRRAQTEADRVAALAGAAIDWRLKAADAPIHMRQIVEILRLLYRGADVLILDEPTAVLAPSQIKDLLALMRKLKAEGRTIVFISHKLEEVMNVADAITVMRSGQVVATTTPSATSVAELASAMVGEAVGAARLEPRPRASGAPLFSARGLVGVDAMGFARLGPVDLDLFRRRDRWRRRRRRQRAGRTRRLRGRTCRPCCRDNRVRRERPNRALDLALPRGGSGLRQRRPRRGGALPRRLHPRQFRRRPRARTRVLAFRVPAVRSDRRGGAEGAHSASVRFGALGDPASSLSGGNQQRLAIARELEREPKLLVAAQPTRGVDIGGTAFIHDLIAAFRDRGGAVLLVSESLDEILAVSDRIVCLYKGRIIGEVDRAEASVDGLGLGRMMLG